MKVDISKGKKKEHRLVLEISEQEKTLWRELFQRLAVPVPLENQPASHTPSEICIEETVPCVGGGGTSEKWTFYLKPRANDSRFLLAHPEKYEWVATLLFHSVAAEKIGQAMLNPDFSELDVELLLGRQGPSFPSNLELVFRNAGS